jgi:peptidoglycan/LPS O-acetylase OafA/YrhL
VPTTPAPTYTETLRVPLRWWTIATMFHASTLLALLVAGLGVWAVAVMAVVVAITVALLLAYGSARIVVSGGQLTAGRARIPLDLLRSPRPLDAEQTRARIGPLADARAYLLLRPYVAPSVVVDVTDPRDPAPYWLLSTRRPELLAEALAAAVAPTDRSVSPDLDRAD